MGAIDSMRAEALAGRALQDMGVRTLDNARQVNAAFGGAISQARDSLEQLIQARADQGNQKLAKIRSTMGGAGGVMDQVTKSSIALVATFLDVSSLFTNLVGMAGTIETLQPRVASAGEDYKNYLAVMGKSDDADAKVSKGVGVLSNGSPVVSVAKPERFSVGMGITASGVPAGATIISIDLVANTITLSANATSTGPVTLRDSKAVEGADKAVRMRDALMPRMGLRRGAAGEFSNFGADQGGPGTWRPI